MEWVKEGALYRRSRGPPTVNLLLRSLCAVDPSPSFKRLTCPVEVEGDPICREESCLIGSERLVGFIITVDLVDQTDESLDTLRSGKAVQ